MNTPQGTITLIGSGEFGEAMGKVYRTILARLPDAPNAVFLDTPAGFELNADAIYTKAAEYFAQRLDLNVQLASFKNKARASALDIEAALRVLRRADFIFAGPGSPGYAIRNWKNTPLWDMLRDRFEHDAHLVFASAAAIAVGAFALPVYEIYKAGEDPHWLDGMNLFAALGMNLAIVPHWNNTEGGTYDTRFCYMGAARFLEMEQQLPGDTVVLGIDEYTACLFDLPAQQCYVMGAGNVTLHCDGQEWVYASGETFPFSQLRAGALTRAGAPLPRASADDAKHSLLELARALDATAAPSARRALIEQAHAVMHQIEGAETHAPQESSDATTRYLMQLARALDETQEPAQKRTLLDRAHNTMHELAADWMDDAHTSEQESIAPYVETLIHVRQELRAAKQYALADEIRARLHALGIILEDSSAGTTWRKANSSNYATN
jgi:cyanophycinase-like exopeptidase